LWTRGHPRPAASLGGCLREAGLSADSAILTLFVFGVVDDVCAAGYGFCFPWSFEPVGLPPR
jgi:hypothetical protein